MSIIVLDQLTVKYPGRKQPTLEALSLTLTAGETVLLLGASGSGKSTLALTLNGLIPHSVGTITAGRVHVGGADTQETPVGELARQVGIVFQDPEAQFVTLNVEDEILFGLENLCLPPELMAARVRAALDQVGMAAYHRHPVDRLSGGQKQRIALAALLALEPQVLVFDEPTANLDPVGTRDVFARYRTFFFSKIGHNVPNFRERDKTVKCPLDKRPDSPPAGWKRISFFPKILHDVQHFWEKDRSRTMLPQAKPAFIGRKRSV